MHSDLDTRNFEKLPSTTVEFIFADTETKRTVDIVAEFKKCTELAAELRGQGVLGTWNNILLSATGIVGQSVYAVAQDRGSMKLADIVVSNVERLGLTMRQSYSLNIYHGLQGALDEAELGMKSLLAGKKDVAKYFVADSVLRLQKELTDLTGHK